jgi:signal transduction histidine kinase
VLAGLIAAFLINNDAPHVAMYLLVGPMAFGTALVLGLNSVRLQASRAVAQATREAFSAQLLSEQSLRVSHLDEVLKALQSTNHDARSALSGALLSIDRLVRVGSRTSGAHASLVELAGDALRELGQLKSILEAGRESHAHRPQDEACDLTAALDELAPRLRERFPGCTIEIVVDQDCTACIAGGKTSASRILTNLIANACEGDGTTGARHIAVRLSTHPQPSLTVTDDGPGLPQRLLNGHIKAFATTKAYGTGLGLYTVDRLVRASGGTLSFGQGPNGRGGRVSVQLRAAT